MKRFLLALVMLAFATTASAETIEEVMAESSVKCVQKEAVKKACNKPCIKKVEIKSCHKDEISELGEAGLTLAVVSWAAIGAGAMSGAFDDADDVEVLTTTLVVGLTAFAVDVLR